jgi:RimJ/RimL family protein N-acetyltransferase
VIPELRLKHRTYFRLRTTSEAWTSQLFSIFAKAELKPGRYMFYSFEDQIKPRWKDKIPAGFKLKLINADFLLNSPYENIKFVIAEIRQMWPSVDHFIEYGFGFSLVTNGKVVSWCTSEYMSKDKCGIGIETLREYRNKGLATVAASAFVEHSLQRDIKPHWECDVENVASRRVAEKVGFVKELDYLVYYGRFS